MSRVTVQWRGDEWLRASLPSFNAGLAAAAAVAADHAARKFGTEGGGVIGPGGSIINVRRGSKPTATRGKQRYVASPPGTYPGVRRGLLRASVTFASPERLGTPLHAAYGTGTKYGRFLELGTSRMAARPWAMRAALEAQPRMAAIFTQVTKQSLLAAGLVEIKR